MATTETIFIAVDVETGDSVKGLEKLRADLKGVEAEIKSVERARKRGTITAKEANKQLTKLDVTLKQNRKSYNDASKAAAGFSKKAGSFAKLGNTITKSFKKVGAAVAAAFAARAVIGAIGDMINIFKDFEQAGANLASVLGKTKGEIKALTDDAKRLGAVTAFTASEVIELQTEFAKLGFKENEILAATEATLALAAATGSELAEAASVAGATLGGFGLAAKETQRVVDVMAKAFSISALDMEKFKESMKNAAPAAKALGIDVETTTALLGTLAKAGVTGSKAGNSLKTGFINLNKAGLTLNEGLEQVANSEDKLSTATKLVGKNAATAFLILADGRAITDDYADGLRNAGGAADEMAKTQLDTLGGQLKILNSAWEGFVLSIEDGDGVISKALRGALSIVTGLLGTFTELNKSQEEIREQARNESLLQSFKDDAQAVTELTEELAGAYDTEAEAREKATESIREQLKVKEHSSNILREVEDLEKRIAVLDESTEAVKVNTDATVDGNDAGEDDIKITTDLIALKKEEIKARGEISATTEEATAIKNDEVKALQDELKVLQELGQFDEVDDTKIESIKATSAAEIEAGESKLEMGKRLAAAGEEEDLKIEEDRVKKIEDDQLELEQDALKRQIKLDGIAEGLEGAQNLANVFTDNKLKALDKEAKAELAIINQQERDGLLSKDQAEQARRKLDEDTDKKQQELEKKAFQRNKAFQLAQVAVNLASQISAIQLAASLNPLNAVTFGAAGVTQAAVQTGIAIGAAALNVGAIALQKFEKGGILAGPSHAQGGIGLSVGGNIVAEAEGGEPILTKGVSQNPSLLAAASRINVMGGGRPLMQNGGITPSFDLPTADTNADLAAALGEVEIISQVSVTEIMEVGNNVQVTEGKAQF